MAFSGAKVYVGTTYAIPGTGATAVDFNSEEYDTDGYHDNVTNNSRLTAPFTGWYYVQAQLDYSVTGFIAAGINSVGGDPAVVAYVAPSNATAGPRTQLSGMVYLEAGEYVVLNGTKATGGGNIVQDTTWMSIEYLGA